MNSNNEIKKVTYSGMFINILLSVLKIFTGLAGNSQAAVADGVHSLSDLSTDIAIIIGLKFWSAPPDSEHPYGHGRIETIVTLFIGLTLMIAGSAIGYDALITIRDPHIDKPELYAVSGIILSILLKEFLYRWTISVGKKIGSQAVIANAWHHRSDAFSSVMALISVSAAVLFPGLEFVDHIGAVVVSGFIVKVSFDILKRSFGELSDSGLCPDDIRQIRKLSMSVKGVKDVHAIRSRKYGSGSFIDLHVLVDDQMAVKEAHDIAEEVKFRIIKEGPAINDVVVHIEPYNYHMNSDI